MNYRELRKIYYSHRDRYEEEYQLRLQGYSSIRTSLYPHLMQRDTVKTSQYPLFVTLHLGISQLMETISQQSQRISEIADTLPKIAHDQFYKEQLYQSIISTNEIEGIHTTRKELVDVEKLLEEDPYKTEQIKHLSTLRMYQQILKDEFLQIQSLEDIRGIYDQLTQGEISPEDELDGEFFRQKSVFIQDDKTGKVIYIPPQKEEQIQVMLTEWIRFINDHSIPNLIKACAGHYFFENIHPFYDGNGRTGRYILAKYLSRKLDKFSGLVLSQQINHHKQDYYKAFRNTGNHLNRADATFFVETLLTFIKEGQENIIQTLLEKQEQLHRYKVKIEQTEGLEEVEKYILFLLAQSKLFVDDKRDGIEDRSIIQLANQSNHHYSKKKIKDAFLHLEERGILTLIGRKPSQHYLSDYF